MLKISKCQAQEIIDLYVGGTSSSTLSKRFNLRKSSVCKIIQGYSWKECVRPVNIKEIANDKWEQSQMRQGWNDEYYKEFPPLTKNQQSILVGSLLGDGYIVAKQDRQHKFGKEQCAKFKEYLDWHFQELQPYSCSIKERHRDTKLVNNNGIIGSKKVNKHLSSYVFTTKAHPLFTELRKQWYPLGKKVVPQDIILSPEAIAVWYCDDGCNSFSGRRANIYTNGFSMEEVAFLAEKLKSFAVNPRITTKVSKYTRLPQPILSFSGKSYDEFIVFIKPYIDCNCFQYKIEWRKARCV